MSAWAVAVSAQPQLNFNKVVTRAPAITNAPFKPEPGAKLNHTQIMFEYPAVSKAMEYHLVVRQRVVNDKKDTTIVPAIDQRDSTTATLVDGLHFNSLYEWDVEALDASGKTISKSPTHRFSILYFPETDPALNRVRVIKNDSKNVSGLVTLDYSHSIVNRAGDPVWTVVPIPMMISPSDLIRDIRVTPQGTITMLTTRQVYELDIDGKILWKGPNDGAVSGDKSEYYHHAFQRLPNGNYLAMSNEIIVKNLPDGSDTVRVNFGTLIEYPFWGKPVWVWRSKDYFTGNEIFNSRSDKGKLQASLHLNAVSVDAKGEYLYAGFRDMNRVLKIEKKTGKVVASYGNKMFWHQHDANIFPDGTIAVFNNDSIADPKITSSAMIFDQSTPPKITWKLDCNFDSLSNGKSEKMGSVDLLPNGHYLIDMGGVNRVIEVSREKEIFWDVFPESWSVTEKKWTELKQYRAHYASSLYPCYFTARLSQDAWTKGTKQVLVKITNEGTEADTYTISYTVKGKADAPVVINVDKLEASKTTAIPVKPAKGLGKGETLEIKITSVTNPVFFRTLTIAQ